MKIASSVDWLTITTRQPHTQQQVVHCLEKLLVASPGGVKKSWGWRGYRGWQYNGIRWGQREADHICILHGYDAALMWRVLLPHADNCSRVDLAVDVHLPAHLHSDLVRTYYEFARQNTDLYHYRSNARIENSKGGKTLYVGSRFSDTFGRIYDKGAQQEDGTPINAWWRYEVEFKNDVAKKMHPQLLALPETPLGVASAICATVYDWFNTRQFPPIYEKNITHDRLITKIQARNTDVSRTLAWLTKSVRPAVRRLQAAGYTNEVLDALDLPVPEGECEQN